MFPFPSVPRCVIWAGFIQLGPYSKKFVIEKMWKASPVVNFHLTNCHVQNKVSLHTEDLTGVDLFELTRLITK